MGCGSSRKISGSYGDEGSELSFDKPEEKVEIFNEKSEVIKDLLNIEKPNNKDEIRSPYNKNGTGNLGYLKSPGIKEDKFTFKKTPQKNKKNARKGETAVAFEVVDDSLIKKHPPKKFQKLEDMQENLTLTPEELEKKQEIARKRRENLLSKRVQSAKERSAKSAHIRSNTDENDEDINDAIESPEDM